MVIILASTGKGWVPAAQVRPDAAGHNSDAQRMQPDTAFWTAVAVLAFSIVAAIIISALFWTHGGKDNND